LKKVQGTGEYSHTSIVYLPDGKKSVGKGISLSALLFNMPINQSFPDCLAMATVRIKTRSSGQDRSGDCRIYRFAREDSKEHPDRLHTLGVGCTTENSTQKILKQNVLTEKCPFSW
jgi:hypothetical protein